MKSIIQNIISNKTISRIINIIIISFLNLLFVAIILYLSTILFSISGDRKLFLFFLVIIFLSTLPVLNFFLDRLSSVTSPVSYGDLYIRAIDLILNMGSVAEIEQKVFELIIKLMNAGSGHIICYSDEREVIDIEYQNNKIHDVIRRNKGESDLILSKQIKGPDDIIIRTKVNKSTDSNKELLKALGKLSADIIVPIYYNNKLFGIIGIGQKKGFSEKEIKLLKIIAFKLATILINSFYYKEIRKRREVEKEYELTNKIQKQFLPEPSLVAGKITIKAYHNTASSLTREFYDIFVNDTLPDDIRISAYSVCGDVKEISIFMPGIQAMLQSYARLGFPPLKTLSKLENMIKERNIFNGDLMIFHSSVKQSGEFTSCYSEYPAPFLYQRSSGLLVQLTGAGRMLQHLKIIIKGQDIIILACGHYSKLMKADIPKYSELIGKNYYLPLDEIKDSLVMELNKFQSSRENEEEDKLIILVTVRE